MNKQLLFEEEFLQELNDLKSRALKVNYKNQFPKLPSKKYNFEQSMVGFNYRLSNWKKQLLQLENPGGLPSSKPLKTTFKIENLEESGNFVIKKAIDSDIISEEN